MTTITVTLPEDRLQLLNEIASRYNVAPEELVRISVEDLLAQSDEAFQRALEIVLKKNADLYRRLA